MCKCFIRELKAEIEQRIARDLNVQDTITDVLRIERELRSVTDLRQGNASRLKIGRVEPVKFAIRRDI